MLRGPSGGGKTTLLNILGTIDKATAGTVEILGQPVDVHSTDAYLSQLRLEKIGTYILL
jgi:putative ABC transport system ATP-binding protein